MTATELAKKLNKFVLNHVVEEEGALDYDCTQFLEDLEDSSYNEENIKEFARFKKDVVKEFGKFTVQYCSRQWNDPDTFLIVLKFGKNLVGIRNYYNSWESCDWSDSQFEAVKQKTVTVFE